MKKKWLYGLLLTLCLVSVSYVAILIILDDKVKRTQKVRTYKNFSANEFIVHVNDKKLDLGNFVEKAIVIEGEIKEITFRHNKYSIVLKGNKNKSYILCEMQTDQNRKVSKLVTGKNIKLKGILKGALMDIILLNCIILDERIDE